LARQTATLRERSCLLAQFTVRRHCRGRRFLGLLDLLRCHHGRQLRASALARQSAGDYARSAGRIVLFSPISHSRSMPVDCKIGILGFHVWPISGKKRR
jgi:hypothetical protein